MSRKTKGSVWHPDQRIKIMRLDFREDSDSGELDNPLDRDTNQYQEGKFVQ